ncbi:hypothetical protein FRC14_003236 [Serendipita sp. 396]|nr:hypothetical protein FRC14_003236 [Serendipita sp. 396]KAG8784768.1 hypothetical protein FRC15_002636 [Serendipita sp. 397]KAG8828225.1 hypothetical protein FRC19_008341 [Serendipita sp. 401]KAG9058719.1 hypothetical protein FS842_003508 [Serendipita sp. 407]
MLDTSPLVPTWKFCDQDLIATFFGGREPKDPSYWGEITKEELGDPWLPVLYYVPVVEELVGKKNLGDEVSVLSV